jgi:hypothetical protein
MQIVSDEIDAMQAERESGIEKPSTNTDDK